LTATNFSFLAAVIMTKPFQYSCMSDWPHSIVFYITCMHILKRRWKEKLLTHTESKRIKLRQIDISDVKGWEDLHWLLSYYIIAIAWGRSLNYTWNGGIEAVQTSL
jgi:hypothetical protein